MVAERNQFLPAKKRNPPMAKLPDADSEVRGASIPSLPFAVVVPHEHLIVEPVYLN